MDDIKSMLQKGYSAEDLRKMLNNEIKTANESIEKEKAAAAAKKEEASRLNDARAKFTNAITTYLGAITGTPPEWTKDNIQTINELLGDFEKVVKRIDTFSDFEKELQEKGKAERHYHTDDADTILKGFIERF